MTAISEAGVASQPVPELTGFLVEEPQMCYAAISIFDTNSQMGTIRFCTITQHTPELKIKYNEENVNLSVELD